MAYYLRQIKVAQAVCQIAHGEQKRKYVNNPYWWHPFAVAKLVRRAGYDHQMQCAAYLHDVLEDTHVTEDQLRLFLRNDYIVKLVVELTEVKTQGNRATRKAAEIERWAKCSDAAKAIKLADLYHNTKSIVKHDLEFAKIYLQEKSDLLNVLSLGDKGLWQMCEESLKNGFEALRVFEREKAQKEKQNKQLDNALWDFETTSHRKD